MIYLHMKIRKNQAAKVSRVNRHIPKFSLSHLIQSKPI